MRFSILAAIATAVSSASALSLGKIYELSHQQSQNANGNGATDANPINLAASGVQYFDQPIDHFNGNGSTFKQRWWYNDQYYKPGGPIYLLDPGEASAALYLGYLTKGETKDYASATNGMIVIMEHRYFGASQPFSDMSTDHMRYHTLDQNMEDLVNFMSTVKIPSVNTSINAPAYPWVHLGTSYPGMRAAYLKNSKPNFLFAASSSSAPVQAEKDYWQYFMPVYAALPRNCTNDVQLIVKHVDQILGNGTAQQISDLKAVFGLQDLKTNDDFAATLPLPFFYWQSYYWTDPEAQTMQFCDMLETIPGKNGTYASAKGQGLNVSLPIYGQYIKSQIPSLCGTQDLNDCLGTHDANNSLFTDITNGNDNRGWLYLVCTAFGFYQIAPPPGVNAPRIIPALMNSDYYQHQCPLYFPDGQLNKIPSEPAVAAINSKWGGWNIGAKKCVQNLFWISGQFDPWGSLGVNSIFGAPNHGKRPNTEECPNEIIAGGSHGWNDLGLGSGSQMAPPAVQKVVKDVRARFEAWLPLWGKNDTAH